MDNLHDEELVTLLSLGGWIRGTQVVSDVVLKNFSQQTSCILRQPALVEYLRGKLDKLSPKTKDSRAGQAGGRRAGRHCQTGFVPAGGNALEGGSADAPR